MANVDGAKDPAEHGGVSATRTKGGEPTKRTIGRASALEDEQFDP